METTNSLNGVNGQSIAQFKLVIDPKWTQGGQSWEQIRNFYGVKQLNNTRAQLKLVIAPKWTKGKQSWEQIKSFYDVQYQIAA